MFGKMEKDRSFYLNFILTILPCFRDTLEEDSSERAELSFDLLPNRFQHSFFFIGY